jgi:hypothetical protein
MFPLIHLQNLTKLLSKFCKTSCAEVLKNNKILEWYREKIIEIEKLWKNYLLAKIGVDPAENETRKNPEKWTV